LPEWQIAVSSSRALGYDSAFYPDDSLCEGAVAPHYQKGKIVRMTLSRREGPYQKEEMHSFPKDESLIDSEKASGTPLYPSKNRKVKNKT
jgi:hypothetical protein